MCGRCNYMVLHLFSAGIVRKMAKGVVANIGSKGVKFYIHSLSMHTQLVVITWPDEYNPSGPYSLISPLLHSGCYSLEPLRLYNNSVYNSSRTASYGPFIQVGAEGKVLYSDG